MIPTGLSRRREERFPPVETSNVNDIETKQREASIMGIFAKSK
jgi:hypothetical protein